MNTATCEAVMKLCAIRLRKPSWIRLGQLISKHVSKAPQAKAEDIAEAVIGDYARADME